MDNYLISANYFFSISIVDKFIVSTKVLFTLFSLLFSLDLLTSYIINKLTIKLKLNKNKLFNIKVNWFLLHALWNIIIFVFSFSDITHTLRNPRISLNPYSNYSMIPTYMALTLHLYHIFNIKYKETLDTGDYIHHIVFFLGLGSLSFFIRWGPIQNLSISILTGLPGSIDYIVLVLYKLNIIKKIQGKK